jgi:NAD(P)-dependent dehydrogenase (short-subunit alcohol dehydrogenase family)
MKILDRFRLDHKVVIITGGSRGLGKEMAKALTGAGANVVVTSRDPEKVEAVAEKLSSDYGRVCRGYGCDVRDPEGIASLVARVIDEFGQIDVLINNAGINIRGPIEALSLEEFHQVQETNVTGVWLACRAVAPHMKARRYGRVINVGSTLSIVSIPDRTPYATSKGAGPFGTEMNRRILDDPERYQAFVAQIPLGRWGELYEIGGLALFLSSDASSFVTGAGITIDGGWTAR